MTFENAYWGERPVGLGVIARLIVELQLSSDSYTRGKFIELLGEMGDTSVVPVLVAELNHTDPLVQQWALHALRELGVTEDVAAADSD